MTSMRLTYIPIPQSHHVYLNGIEMREGTDWSDDGTGLITFLGPMAQVSGDLVEVLYAHEGAQADIPVGSFVTQSSAGTFTNTNAFLNTPAHTAGDLLIAFVTTNGPTMATPSGWTSQSMYVRANGSRNYVFSKIGGGQASLTSDSGALSGLTWYNSCVEVWTNGLSHVSAVSWSETPSGTTSHTTPGIAAGGRIIHYASGSNANMSWTTPGAYTRRFNTNSGNSNTHAAADIAGSGDPMVWTSSQLTDATLATLALS